MPSQFPKQQPPQSPPQVVLPLQQSWQPTVSDSAITGATPRWKADETVHRRAGGVFRWVMSGTGVLATFAIFVWVSILNPSRDLVVSLLDELGAWAFDLYGVVSLIGLGFSIYEALQVLRDRATYARPLLSRTATDVRTMHIQPVRNITGPVVVLAETGVTTVTGPGRFIWYLACVLWPLAAGWFIAADVSRTYFQAGIITILACVAIALTTRLFGCMLTPEEVHRNIPAGSGREHTQPGFWPKGFIPSEATDEQGGAGVMAVDKHLFRGTANKFIDDLYKQPRQSRITDCEQVFCGLVGKKSCKKSNQAPEGMSRHQVKLVTHATERAALLGNPRPFKGSDEETDIVTVREFAPVVVIPIAAASAERDIKLCTVLSGGVTALARTADQGNEAFVALQMQACTNGGAADLSRALAQAYDAEPGQQLFAATDGGTAPLTDALTAVDFDNLEVYQDFEWWIPKGIKRTPMIEQSLTVANDAILPSYRLDAKVAGAVWWIDPGERAHIRWVRHEDEKPLLDTLARVYAADNLSLGEGTKFAGVFRTDGLLMPVWGLDNTKPHNHWTVAVEEADKCVAEALANEKPLTAEEHKSRKTIVSRQVTIRNQVPGQPGVAGLKINACGPAKS